MGGPSSPDHRIDFLTRRCSNCLTDEVYLAQGHRVPCLPQVREKNRRRILRWAEADYYRFAHARRVAQLTLEYRAALGFDRWE